ncbi:MAG TPA: cobalamin-independent methionine synthase II family protein [Fimbriimonadaceae bacterium]|nr:cobalamin-independent methionine synthase II family protein [Fimbriimonadaceae bacterium]
MLFPTTTVGSFPRPDSILKALRAKRRGDISAEAFDRAADDAVREVLDLQHQCGIDIVTDGEQRRDNFYSFVADKLEGVQLMTLAEMLDIVEDKAGFEKILQTLDVPAYSISNPTCVGRIRRREPLAVGELQFLKEHTDRPVKIPLPGPYLLTRAMWVPEATGKVYDSKEHLGQDVVKVLREEAEALAAAGAEFIQFDEPVLTELVFSTGATRTFMCAALAARNDPAEELEFAVELINQVVDGLTVRTGMHVCRGNWSRDESTLLQGSYAPLRPYFARMKVDQLVLEYATPRAGELIEVGEKELGLGCVNPRTDTVETAEEIASRVGEATRFVEREKIFLNPDCGFGTFASRPMNEIDAIRSKLKSLVAAAQMLRG